MWKNNDIEEARIKFPGACAPDHKKEPEKYNRWVRQMALWAFQYGPMLLDRIKPQ